MRWATLFINLHDVLRGISFRAIFGVAYIAMAIALVSTPDAGAAQVIGSWGISPKGFGLILGVCGAIILHWRDAAFTWLSLPFLVLCIAVVQYLETRTSGSLVISVIVFSAWVLSQRVAVSVCDERNEDNA